MTDRYQKAREELSEKFDGSQGCIVNPLSDKDHAVYASDILKQDTLEFYKVCERQHTVILYNNNSYDEVLNEEGKKLLTLTRKLVAENRFKDELVEFGIDKTNSGLWHCDVNSPFYDESGLRACLNTYNNNVVIGKSKKCNAILQTSPCIFLDTQEKWCLTKSGSIYKLGTQKENVYELYV